MIARDPTLKPTTAIKSTGVTDPSAIRRLRDKYHSSCRELAKDLKAPATPQPRSAALKMPEARRSSPVETPARQEAGATKADPEPAASPQHNPATPADFLVLWCGLGVQSVTSALELHKTFLDAFMRMPPMATALRGQLALNEMAAAWCPGARHAK